MASAACPKPSASGNFPSPSAFEFDEQVPELSARSVEATRVFTDLQPGAGHVQVPLAAPPPGPAPPWRADPSPGSRASSSTIAHVLGRLPCESLKPDLERLSVGDRGRPEREREQSGQGVVRDERRAGLHQQIDVVFAALPDGRNPRGGLRIFEPGLEPFGDLHELGVERATIRLRRLERRDQPPRTGRAALPLEDLPRSR